MKAKLRDSYLRKTQWEFISDTLSFQRDVSNEVLDKIEARILELQKIFISIHFLQNVKKEEKKPPKSPNHGT